MKNIKILIFAITICMLGLVNVQALEKDKLEPIGPIEHKFTEKEYKYVKEFYGEEYFDMMSDETYKWIKDLHIDENGIEYKFSDDNIASPNGTYVSYSYQTLRISKSCVTTYCSITLLASWDATPTVKGYDVIGVLLTNTTFHNDSRSTAVTSSTGGQAYSNYRVFSNGLGNSVMLPSSGSNIYIEQHVYVEPGGHVYGSYQHANHSVSLATSKSYRLTIAGYGSVFEFTGSAVDVYNGFAGVDISV